MWGQKLSTVPRIVGCVGMVVASAGLDIAPGVHAADEGEGVSIDRLAWMAGCWEGRLSGGSLYEEVWLAPRDGEIRRAWYFPTQSDTPPAEE